MPAEYSIVTSIIHINNIKIRFILYLIHNNVILILLSNDKVYLLTRHGREEYTDEDGEGCGKINLYLVVARS